MALSRLARKPPQRRMKAPVPCHNLNMLILASASPRRRELLTQAGFTFRVQPAHIPEEPRPDEDPIGYVVRLAREKAQMPPAALTAREAEPAGWPMHCVYARGLCL